MRSETSRIQDGNPFRRIPRLWVFPGKGACTLLSKRVRLG